MTKRPGASAGGRAAARVSTTILAPAPGAARLVLRRCSGGRQDCELELAAAVGTLSLGRVEDVDAVATWRRLAAQSGAIPTLESEGGSQHPLQRQLGRLCLDGVQRRRRVPLLSRRRPRFLVRRKASRLPVRPLVFRESEIAAGRGA